MPHDPHHTPPVHERPDEWHRHTADEGAPQPEHGAIANPGLLAIAFFLMVFALAATVGVIRLYFFSTITSVRARKLETTFPAQEWYDEKYTSAPEKFATYGWVDHETVRIPIENAIESVIREYAQRRP